ncbi:hypothetical protein D3C77_500370 [compost metagenome]
MRAQQCTGLERQQRHQQRVDQQHQLGPLRLLGYHQQREPYHEDQVPAPRQLGLRETPDTQQEQPVRRHQQAIGEPDTDQQQAAAAQQREGTAHGDGGEPGAPEQQRGFTHAAPLDRQVQRGGRGEGDRDGEHRGWV